MTRPHVGWYVHHHGRGHAHRAHAVVRELTARGIDVTVLSSLPAEDWAPWVTLPLDDDGVHDPAPSGRLHWAPTDSAGHRERLALVADWAARTPAAAAVVDVSVELVVWLRTLGVPTVSLAMPGAREDAAHDLGHALASELVGAFPAVAAPAHLAPWAAKTTCVGGISRYEGRPRPEPTTPGEGRRVLVVGGAGGSALTPADLDAARAATPGWTWTVAGPLGTWVEDLWPVLHAADVVVAGAGEGSVADLAAAGSRAVVIAEDRPFAEQAATARVLERERLAVVRDAWPQAHEWADVLDDALTLEPRWQVWQVDGASGRFADVVERVAREAHEQWQANR